MSDSLAELNRSVSLDSAKSDFLRFVKTQAIRFQLAERGYREVDSVDIAERVKGVGPRLRSMLEITPQAFGDAKKHLELNSRIDIGALRDGVLHKSAVAIGTVGNSSWAGALAPFAQASVAFLQSLAPFSSFDFVLNQNGFTRLPLRTRIAVASQSATGYGVGESLSKPVAAMAFTQTSNPALKAVGEIVLSDELILMTTPAANVLFEAEMQKCVAKATDAQFVSILVAGAGSTHASTGLTAAQFAADLATAYGSITTEPGSRIYLVLPVATFKTVSLLRDTGGLLLSDQTPSSGKIGGITVLASSGATTTGVLFDASGVGADSDVVTTMVSRQATIEMQDNPTSSDYHLVSLFQNNLTCIRCERFFGATVLRSGSITTITGYS